MKKGWLEKYQDGGNLLAYNDDISIFPKIKRNDTDSLKFTKSEKVVNPYGGLETISETREVPDIREQYMRENSVSTSPTKHVNFNLAINSDDSKQFLNRYNNPWSRQKLKEQSKLTDANIDNMILQGLLPKVKIGGNQSNSKGEYDYKNNQILMSEKNAPVETHERIHASNIDAAQGEYLSKILGNPFQQEGKSAFNKIKRYMQKPYEAYGNFAEFREKIGLKPGEQITEQELKKRVKAKNLSEENFYKVYNDKKIVEALNTVASNNNLQPLDIAQNGAEMNYYREGKDWRPRDMQYGGVIEDDGGQWAHPGKVTKINSNQITMKGVNSPILGISDKGDVKLMHPNKEYKFKGNNVTEFPINNWLNKYS